MKLSYRGHTYDSHPTIVEDTEMLVEGKYRGNPATLHLAKKQASRRAPRHLTYRGVKF